MAERSNLPAPYESPWRQLGRALQAVAASLGLDLRSLWRRNQSGQLPRPPWWPRALAGLWWPLLLTLVLALAGSALLALRPRAPGAAASAPEPSLEEANAMPAATEPSVAESPILQPPAPAIRADEQRPAITVPTPSPTAPDQPQPDPLLEALNQGSDPGLITKTQIQADRGALQLQLASAYTQLEPRRQRRLAEAWLERSLQLGFAHLELVDPQGRVLGYQARVGSGMILLNPAATA